MMTDVADVTVDEGDAHTGIAMDEAELDASLGTAGRLSPLDNADENSQGSESPSEIELSKRDSDLENQAMLDSKSILDSTESSMPLSLNDEFAVGKKVPHEWGSSFDISKLIDENEPLGCCHWLSACFCGMVLRAKRVGHMPVLWTQKLKDGRTDIVCIVGPFWPCLMFVTYPLIIGVSLGTAVYMLPGVHWLIQIVWAICTTTLLVALALTGCRNPGIVRRWPEKPPNCDHWYWSDQVGTFRPPKSQYDGDCGLIIEEFDHTCPWTGTGIGRRNMPAFTTFVSMICVCLIFDILLMVGVGGSEAHRPHEE
mmetsp:Transcript_2454/g.4897  ORF Transcript_2454/g.4897 Transcript_2454/m.4897 type:complete len:311 (+) Transcript_2454:114-1046(+)|eukprot:CAMPEP_0119477892 /NCGR_PEP_ID=MMETSP1344-20130328/7869_1 /TAXON_ID=236787 /ORGANISM="Florenciella parvula, Strain CCMP2471" /LENGTH=310 /DNA_ID=CAMNT_0007511991 /DNA_START=426 /DNA_END=1358 /DNA_ORIENTATION=+